MITTLELVTMFDTFTSHNTAARVVRRQMRQRNTASLTSEQQNIFHHLANHYGDRALTYVHEHQGGRDWVLASPGMVLIQNAHSAHADMQHLGLCSSPGDHSRWAVQRALGAAITCSYTELGLEETRIRLAQLTSITINQTADQ